MLNLGVFCGVPVNGFFFAVKIHSAAMGKTETEFLIEFICAKILGQYPVGTKVTVLDPMDGTLYELCEDMLTKDQWNNDILKLLPIKDYPMFLIFGEIN